MLFRSANGALSYAALMANGGAGNGSIGDGAGRRPAVMAALVEKVQRRRSKRGRDFIVADFSDSSGQFSATCFEEALVEPLFKWAAEGTCLLLNVELDSPSPDEPPRVTVRGARPLAEVRSAARMVLRVDISRPEALGELAGLLSTGAEGRGEVLATLRTGGDDQPVLRLGRDFQLDGEIAERLAFIEGIANVSLTARRGAGNLRLVA